MAQAIEREKELGIDNLNLPDVKALAAGKAAELKGKEAELKAKQEEVAA